jgi:hypothetical protein
MTDEKPISSPKFSVKPQLPEETKPMSRQILGSLGMFGWYAADQSLCDKNCGYFCA